mmetsp:Transcript_22294/g.53095  ORF Transcript_22294/g.53095 Transcript_22294/m.53095 type:complete len:224 (-) Transcript_22294:4001-4672(-)
MAILASTRGQNNRRVRLHHRNEAARDAGVLTARRKDGAFHTGKAGISHTAAGVGRIGHQRSVGVRHVCEGGGWNQHFLVSAVGTFIVQTQHHVPRILVHLQDERDLPGLQIQRGFQIIVDTASGFLDHKVAIQEELNTVVRGNVELVETCMLDIQEPGPPRGQMIRLSDAIPIRRTCVVQLRIQSNIVRLPHADVWQQTGDGAWLESEEELCLQSPLHGRDLV